MNRAYLWIETDRMNLKKRIIILVMLILFGGIPQCVWASEKQINVFKDGQLVKTTAAPKDVKGTIFVPVSGVVNHLGLQVSADGKSKTITLKDGKNTLNATIGSTNAMLNGKKVKLGAAPTTMDGKTMVPGSILKSYFGFSVSYNKANRRLDINLVKTQPVNPAQKETTGISSGSAGQYTAGQSDPSVGRSEQAASGTTQSSGQSNVSNGMGSTTASGKADFSGSIISVRSQYTTFITGIEVKVDSSVFKVEISTDTLTSEMHYEGSNFYTLGLPGLKKGSKINIRAYDDQNHLLQSKDWTINESNRSLNTVK